MASPDDSDIDRGMPRGSPEQEILFLLFGTAAETAYNNLPQNTNYSRLPRDFWIEATSGRVDTYTDWVKTGILDMAKEMTNNMSREETEHFWRRLVGLIRNGVSERRERRMNPGHKFVSNLWEELLSKVAQWMDENGIPQPEEEED